MAQQLEITPMFFYNVDSAEAKASELSRYNHCTFSVYEAAHGETQVFVVVNGVDQSREMDLVARYLNGKAS